MKENKEIVYIMGHKNPDSDSICSAIGYADYKNSIGEVEAIPVRLGDVSRETQFILDYFKVEKPELIKTVRQSVEDLNFDNIAAVNSNISVRTALNMMNMNNVHSLPVVDEHEHLSGIVTVSDIIQSYVDVWNNSVLNNGKATIENIIDTLSAKSLYKSKTIHEFNGKLLVLAMEPDSLREYVEDNDIVICGDRKDIQLEALDHKISLMIVTGDNDVDEDVLEKVKSKDVTLIITPHDTFTASRLITQSVSVKHVMSKNELVYFSLDDLVNDIRQQMSETRFRSYPVVDNKNGVVGSISRYHLISSTKKKVILVDHNERGQSVDGLEEAEILEIIDHHRVADIHTGSPIVFRNEPVGSTCTIIASIMFETGRLPSKKIAGILASGIISDTLLFRSPTSTKKDEIMLERLARIADLDVEEFAEKMFKEGTSLTGKTPQELLTQDFKEFVVKSGKIGIAQVYTMNSDSLVDMKEELIETMTKRCEDNNYSVFLLLLTNIFTQGSEMIVVGNDKEHIAKAFSQELVNDAFYVDGVLSRKKQVVPPITTYFNNLDKMI